MQVRFAAARDQQWVGGTAWVGPTSSLLLLSPLSPLPSLFASLINSAIKSRTSTSSSATSSGLVAELESGGWSCKATLSCLNAHFHCLLVRPAAVCAWQRLVLITVV